MNKNKEMGLLILRCTLGLIFFFQGYGKVVDIGVDVLHDMMFTPTYGSILPGWLTWFTAYFTSYAELIGGLLLIFGLFRDWALYGLGLVLLIVSFGHGLAEPIWDLSHVMFRLVPLVALLLLPSSWDLYRLDTLVQKLRPNG